MSKIVGELNAEIMKKVIHDRRAKLFAEIVAKTGSKQSVIDRAMQEIESLREQVEKLTEECVVLRASSRTKLDTIAYLETREDENQQKLAALTKERDAEKPSERG